MTLDELALLAKTDIDPCAEEFRKPLQQDAKSLALALGPGGQPVLLGSIATPKYVDVLLSAFPQELLFPAEFVGRGDMSRGGLMVRSVDAHLELAYVPVRELPSAAPGHRSCLLGRPDPEPVTHAFARRSVNRCLHSLGRHPIVLVAVYLAAADLGQHLSCRRQL